MKSAWRLGKWIYSGLLGVAIVLAALSSQMRSPWMGNTTEVIAQVQIEETTSTTPSIETAQKPEPKVINKWSTLSLAQKELSQAVSWNELRSFPSLAYKDLVQQLAGEEFENGQPFQLSAQRTIWIAVLNKGLKDYSRKIYRSPHFQGRSGYDLVHYELLLEDGAKAHLLAYREKTENIRMIVGAEDLRPTRIDLYTQPQSGQWVSQSFHPSGELIQAMELNEEEFLTAKESIIRHSVPLLTAGR